MSIFLVASDANELIKRLRADPEEARGLRLDVLRLFQSALNEPVALIVEVILQGEPMLRLWNSGGNGCKRQFKAQVVRTYGAFACEHGGLGDDAAQLANVARP